MKIIYVITGLGLGGAERVVVDLADQMYKLGHDVKIVYLKGEAIVKPKSTDIELIGLGFEGLTSFFSASKKYIRLIQEFKPDIVHAHMVHANIFVRLNRLFKSVPRLICSAHSNNEGGRLRMLAYRLTNSLCEITTNVSQNASSNFEVLGAVKPGHIQTVYNGIDLNKFEKSIYQVDGLRLKLNIDNERPVFIAVGRLHDAKDYPNLLDAFYLFKDANISKNINPLLLIVGDGALKSDLEAKIDNLGLNNDVMLLGKRDDIPQLLNLADFFVLSSKYEGLPTVMMEAMACQKYVIATDCGGSAEILGDTGELVPIQNSEALAGAMETALSLDKHDIELNNQKARLRIEEKFSLESSVQKWLEIYAAK